MIEAVAENLPGDDADVIELSKRDEARAHPAKGTTPFRDIKSRGVPLDPEDLTTEAQVLLRYMFDRGETELSVFADADPVRVTRPTWSATRRRPQTSFPVSG